LLLLRILLISFIYLFFLLGWDLFSSQQMPNSPDGDTFCPSAELDRLHKSVVRNISGEYFFVDWPPNRTIDTQLLLSWRIWKKKKNLIIYFLI
jgi:hypothetical protein